MAGCNVRCDIHYFLSFLVSILTRRDGRVQPYHRIDGAASYEVSILTRRDGRVQQSRNVIRPTRPMSFNPHPARWPGATTDPHANTDANTGFNPHPARWPGATATEQFGQHWLDQFQSSPGAMAGCNTFREGRTFDPDNVSILTRRDGRVQHVIGQRLADDQAGVSILTRRDGRVQRAYDGMVLLVFYVSILTRRDGRVQRP